MNKSIVAIYIGTSRFTAVEVDTNQQTYEVLRWVDVTLPAEGFNPEWLRALWAKEKFTSNRVVQMISPAMVRWKTTQMPLLPKEELLSALSLEYASANELFRLVEMYPNDGGVLVKTAHVPLGELRDSIEGMEKAGLKVLWSGLSSHGAAAFIHFHRDFFDDTGDQLYLHLMGNHAELGLVGASGFLFRRTLAIDARVFREGSQNTMADMIGELHLTLAAAAKAGTALPGKIWMLGPDLPDPEVLDRLKTELSIAWVIPEKTRLGGVLTAIHTPKLAGLIGLALEELGLDAFRDLRVQTVEQLEQTAGKQRQAMLLRLAGIIGLIGLGIVLGVGGRTLKVSKDARWLAEHTEKIQALNRIARESNRQHSQIKSLEHWLANRHQELEFLRVLQENLPDLTEIRAITIEAGNLKNLSGITPSVSGLLALFQKDPVLRHLKLKGSITLAKDGREEFQLEGPLMIEEQKP